MSACWAKPRFTTRPVIVDFGKLKLEDYHPKLHGAFQDSQPLTAKLPSLSALENFLDNDPGSAEARDGKDAADLLMRQRRSADDRVLLSREHLAALFGGKDFKWIEHWGVRMPFSEYINTFTGQPTQVGRAECVVCGHGRWGPNFSYFYEALTECVNPHLVTKGALTLLQTLCAPPAETLLFPTSRLPDHMCSGLCTGFALQA